MATDPTLQAVLQFHDWQINRPHEPVPAAVETMAKPVEEKELPFDPTEPEEEEEEPQENEKKEKPR